MIENDFLREEPPGYGGTSKLSPVLAYLRRIEADHRAGNDTEHTHRPALKRRPLQSNWNNLHIQSRQEICWGACVSEEMADKLWHELDEWLQVLLADSVNLRSRGKLELNGGYEVVPGANVAGIDSMKTEGSKP